jgi:polygalacturonase
VEYDIKDYGAVGDGKVLDTKAIQTAIDTCSKTGGGEVAMRNGTFLSGTIFIKNNVTLKVEASAKLLASGNLEDYAPRGTIEPQRYPEPQMDHCFIYAENAKNIGICGRGEINGNGGKFPNRNKKYKYEYRPMLIRFFNCQYIQVKDVKLRDPAAWTSAFLDCSDIWVRGVDIEALIKGNGDGLDFDSCQNIVISDCKIVGTDDTICLQNSKPDRICKNVVITNCILKSACACIRFGYMSAGNIKDVVVSNCILYDTFREGIKIQSCEGADIENISFDNIVMRDVGRPIVLHLNRGIVSPVYYKAQKEPEDGGFRNVSFSNIQIVNGLEIEEPILHGHNREIVVRAPWYNGIFINAKDGSYIEDVSIRNLSYRLIGGVKKQQARFEEYPPMDYAVQCASPLKYGKIAFYNPAYFLYSRNVKGLTLENINIELIKADERPAMVFDEISDLEIIGLKLNADKSGDDLIYMRNVNDALLERVKTSGKKKNLIRKMGKTQGIDLVNCKNIDNNNIGDKYE